MSSVLSSSHSALSSRTWSVGMGFTPARGLEDNSRSLNGQVHVTKSLVCGQHWSCFFTRSIHRWHLAVCSMSLWYPCSIEFSRMVFLGMEVVNWWWDGIFAPMLYISLVWFCGYNWIKKVLGSKMIKMVGSRQSAMLDFSICLTSH